MYPVARYKDGAAACTSHAARTALPRGRTNTASQCCVQRGHRDMRSQRLGPEIYVARGRVTRGDETALRRRNAPLACGSHMYACCVTLGLIHIGGS